MSTPRKQIQNLFIDQGATYSKTLTVKDSTGTAVDITGYTFAGQARTSRIAPSPSFTLTVSILSASAGTITVSMTYNDTEDIEERNYLYDIEGSIGAARYRVFSGVVFVTGEMTKVPDSSSSSSSSSSST